MKTLIINGFAFVPSVFRAVRDHDGGTRKIDWRSGQEGGIMIFDEVIMFTIHGFLQGLALEAQADDRLGLIDGRSG